MHVTREEPIRESTRLREAYFADFAKKARKAAPKTVIMVTGGFRSRAGMAAAVSGGVCDLVGIARPAALEPHLPKDKILNIGVADGDAAVVPTVIQGGEIYRKIPLIGLGTESVSCLPQVTWSLS